MAAAPYKEFIPWPEPDAAAAAAADDGCAARPAAAAAQPAAAAAAAKLPLPLLLALAGVATIFGSTGPSWFKLMGPTIPPLTKAFFRMAGTALVQLPLAALEMRSQRWDAARFRAYLAMLPRVALPVGALMGLHFACVAGAASLTSFAHVMSTVNTAPLFFTAFFLLRHAAARALALPTPAAAAPDAAAGALPPPPPPPPPLPFLHAARSPLPSLLEVLGAVVAFCGVVALVSLDSGSSSGGADLPVSAAGDAVGLGASLFMALYLVGGGFRGATPLFSWMLPLHFFAALVVGGLALASGATLSTAAGGLFSNFVPLGGPVMLATLGAVLAPSLVAHSLVNLLTPADALGPFLVSMFLNLQPLTGNVFGWLMGLQGQPTWLSVLCAPLIVAGTVLATMGKQGRRCPCGPRAGGLGSPSAAP